MKLIDLIINLQKLMVIDPMNGNLDVVFSIDDEGNGYEEIYFDPALGTYDKEEKEFHSVDDFEEDDEIPTVNAVCIN